MRSGRSSIWGPKCIRRYKQNKVESTSEHYYKALEQFSCSEVLDHASDSKNLFQGLEREVRIHFLVVGPSSRRQKNEVSETNTDYAFLKKINSHTKSYNMLRTKFVSEIFLFDASLYFLCNLKINSVFNWVDIYPCLHHYYSLLFSIFDCLTIL